MANWIVSKTIFISCFVLFKKHSEAAREKWFSELFSFCKIKVDLSN